MRLVESLQGKRATKECAMESSQSLIREYLDLKDKIEQLEPFDLKIIQPRLWADHRAEFYILPEDFERDTPAEKLYLYKYRAVIMMAFSNRCAICLAHDKGIEMDHHFICKVDGGTFGLKHRNGIIMNNTVPLCVPCNRKKKDKSYKLFCSKEQIARIRHISDLLTLHVNSMTLLKFPV